MKNVKLELYHPQFPFEDRYNEDPTWKLFIDGRPYPCAAKSIMNYAQAMEIIHLASDIEGVTND